MKRFLYKKDGTYELIQDFTYEYKDASVPPMTYSKTEQNTIVGEWHLLGANKSTDLAKNEMIALATTSLIHKSVLTNKTTGISSSTSTSQTENGMTSLSQSFRVVESSSKRLVLEYDAESNSLSNGTMGYDGLIKTKYILQKK